MWISLFGYVGDVPYKLKDYLVNTNLLFNFGENNTHMKLKDKKRIARLMEVSVEGNKYNYTGQYQPYKIIYRVGKVRYSAKYDMYKVDVIIESLQRRYIYRDPITRLRVLDKQGNYKYEYLDIRTPDRSQVFRVNRNIRFESMKYLKSIADMFSVCRTRIEADKVIYSELQG